MRFGRKLETDEERKFWKSCYEIGMSNGWCSGKFDEEDGNSIVEEDRLNMNSVCVIDTRRELIRFFKNGNWCLGQAVIHKNLCFVQQVDGGDEYLTMKKFSDDVVRSFESISFGRMIEDGDNVNDYIIGLYNTTVFLTDRDFVKHNSKGNIIRDKEGLAVLETRMCTSISYGEYLRKDMKGMYGVIAV